MACGHYFGVIYLTDCGGVRQAVYRYTVSLLAGVEAVYNFKHPLKGEVVRINGEDATFVHSLKNCL